MQRMRNAGIFETLDYGCASFGPQTQLYPPKGAKGSRYVARAFVFLFTQRTPRELAMLPGAFPIFLRQ
jgi:hypothetical protein